MKYFFLSEGWIYNRVWERGGLWNEIRWRRKPHIRPLGIGIVENSETLWLHEVETSVLMVEVIPTEDQSPDDSNIGQVVLKRLIDSQQVLETLVEVKQIVKKKSET